MAASPLTTDLYQLTMMAGYFAQGRHERTVASFELFVRHLPRNRNYLIAAGLPSVIEYLEQLRFSDAEISWLRQAAPLARVPAEFFDYLRDFKFTGDVWAIPEGTPVFAHEPLVRITAPIAQAQLIETAALACITFQTSIASKAARVVSAAAGRPVMEFGARRAHGLEAALFAARAAFLAGAAGTSFVEAGRRFGIPLSGTMAHSWVMSADSEAQAFDDYASVFGGQSVFLLDTYDTISAARLVVSSGLQPAGVRLDSGDLDVLSREVRTILDAGGLSATGIFVSGDLDEFSIRRLLSSGAPIDGFGVGTRLVTSEDAPALGGIYKLVEIEERGIRRGVVKRSEAKGTWPGRKQVWRIVENASAARDVVGFADEEPPADGVPLLRQFMRGGQRLNEDVSLVTARHRCARLMAELPARLVTLEAPRTPYEVDPSAALSAALDRAPAP